MRVHVRFAGPLRDAAGVKDATLDLKSGANTGDALAEIARLFPGVQRELFGEEAKKYYSIFLNDALVPEFDRHCAKLHEGDELLVLLPIAGGGGRML